MSNTFTMSTDKHISRLDGNYSPAVVLSLLDALQRRYHYFSARKTSCSCITVWNHNRGLLDICSSRKNVVLHHELDEFSLLSSHHIHEIYHHHHHHPPQVLGLCCLQCFLSTLVFSTLLSRWCTGLSIAKMDMWLGFYRCDFITQCLCSL